jgi:hypothetical protein
MVLLGGMRHDIPNMDTLSGLGVSNTDYLEISEEGNIVQLHTMYCIPHVSYSNFILHCHTMI